MTTRKRRTSCLASLALLTLAPAAGAQPAADPDRDVEATALRLDGESLSALRFRNLGPAAMSGRIVDIEVSLQDPLVFYVASATGGVWKTTNNGVTFTPLFEQEAVHSIGDVALDSFDDDTVWVGTGERANRQSSSWGNGVYKSTDGGETWSHLGLDDSHHVGRIAVHPRNPEIVFVAAMGHLWGANEERGLYRTSDGGETWERVLFLDADTGVADVAIDPQRPKTIYAAAYQRRRTAFGFHGGGARSGLYKSTDGGRSWSVLTDLLPELEDAYVGRIGISIYPQDSRIVYVCVEQGLRYTASTSYEERKAGVYRSTDRGRTWTRQSDWNPRPMYASQILVDPNDPDRVYMQNSFSISKDAGKTFDVPRQSVHSDDRFLWVDPRDSRHIMKASDGALATSWDGGETWLWAAHLPVSQYYRVAVDDRDPYWIYGGLQDNGTWAGPNETYRSEGVLNEDWIRIGGGDGFAAAVDPGDDDIVYAESQYLGLFRRDMKTGETQTIRPGDPQGSISGRKNWDHWGSDKPIPELGNAMEPANWDGPFLISPHDRETLYAGTRQLWRSTDRGHSWVSLGDLTSRTDRAELEIMGDLPSDTVPSLDDGIPYWPTISAIAESPLERGLLYVGTDDGRLQVSRDGGESFHDVIAQVPGLPRHGYVSDLEASRWEAGTVYAAFDLHRSDDFENHLYRSRDSGKTWTSIAGDLPLRQVVRTVREDPRSQRLLYVATELGFFATVDAGAADPHWLELGVEMPTVAVNDFVIHERDNDLILATHGRGLWILDSLTSLQELRPEIAADAAHLFSIEPARMIRRQRVKAASGDLVFRGENPPEGAIVDYWLGRSYESAEADSSKEEEAEEEAEGEASEGSEGEPAGSAVQLSVRAANGSVVRELEPSLRAGMNRVIWDLRHESWSAPARSAGEGERRRFGPRRPRGPLVVPGTYTVLLEVEDRSWRTTVEVREDPRIVVGADERRRWTVLLLELGELYEDSNELVAGVLEAIGPREEIASEIEGESAEGRSSNEIDEPEVDPELAELRRVTEELRSRIQRLAGEIEDWTGSPTADQDSQRRFYAQKLEELRARVDERQSREGSSSE